jgi:hypothetical protein
MVFAGDTVPRRVSRCELIVESKLIVIQYRVSQLPRSATPPCSLWSPHCFHMDLRSSCRIRAHNLSTSMVLTSIFQQDHQLQSKVSESADSRHQETGLSPNEVLQKKKRAKADLQTAHHNVGGLPEVSNVPSTEVS